MSHFADVAFFWEAPRAMAGMGHIPWAVTASLAFKNTGLVFFSPAFLKTGGGEDVDACLQVRVCLQKFVQINCNRHIWGGTSGCDHTDHKNGAEPALQPAFKLYIM